MRSHAPKGLGARRPWPSDGCSRPVVCCRPGLRALVGVALCMSLAGCVPDGDTPEPDTGGGAPDAQADGGDGLHDLGGQREVPSPVEVRSLVLADDRACAITNTGRLMCWGGDPESGEVDGAGDRLQSLRMGSRTAMLHGVDGIRRPSPGRRSLYFGGFDVHSIPLDGTARLSGTDEPLEQADVADYTMQGFSACVLDYAGRSYCRYQGADYFTEFPSVTTRRWQAIAPKSGWIGCGRPEGEGDSVVCWIGDFARPEEPRGPDDFVPKVFMQGDERVFPDAPGQFCANEGLVCIERSGGSVECFFAGRTHIDRAKFGDQPLMTLALGAPIVELGCSSKAGLPRVCALDSEGAVWCVAQGEEVTQAFEGRTVHQISMSRAGVCGLVERGKVVCSPFDEAGTRALLPVPVGFRAEAPRVGAKGGE